MDPVRHPAPASLVASELAEVEAQLAAFLEVDLAAIPTAVGGLAFAGGKRLRPLVALLAAQAAGLADPRRITIAAVGELLHTATLLHDDVVDGGEFRRGRPAPRIGVGNQMAVLAGDYCLARAVQAIGHLGVPRALSSFGDMVTRMAAGEVEQLALAGARELPLDRYERVIERKTAALIAWCSAVGELVDARHIAPLQQYGRHLGLAFQIADDILDYESDLEVAGKRGGQDLRDGKRTLPLLLAVGRDPALAVEVADAFAAGPPLPIRFVDHVIARVRALEGGAAARVIAVRHAGEAVSHLSTLPPSSAREALAELAQHAATRTS